MSHTPLPWYWKEEEMPVKRPMVYRKDGESDVMVSGIVASVFEEANAKFIVRAVNSHEELLAAVGDALEIITWMSGSDDFSEEGPAHEGWVKAREKLTRMFATYYKAGGKRE